MRIFVTGGTGLLGNTIVRSLREAGDQVDALVRGEPDPLVFEGLDVNQVRSELVMPSQEPELADNRPIEQSVPTEVRGNPEDTDVPDESVEDDLIDQAVAECDAVIHSAAMIHLGWNNIEESLRVNRDGTARIAKACLRHSKKMVLVGTVDSIGLGSPELPADENTPIDFAGGAVPCAYVVSKRAALDVVKQYVKQGLNAVTCHPGFMLGPWDWKPSSGRMLLEVGKSWKPIAPSGGCSLCDARDVATGVIAAMKQSCRPGRQYVLAGRNWTYLKIWTEMAKRMGRRPPIRAAGPGMEFLAGLVGDAIGKFTGSEPDFNSAGVKMSGQFHWYSSNRARAELGYKLRPASETLDDAAAWVQQRFTLSDPGESC